MAATGVLRFSGRVAVVTGAGGGLGREYALMLAERGASIVVNDLGGTRSGEGKNSVAADKVVSEIKSKGGKAVADYHSVEDGESIVKTAIDNYGRIDILINNAGILRDKAFSNMTEDDFDIIHKIHLKGSFSVTKAAWPHFRKQKYGRIIMTASGAGIYGNFGQANYSSAKLGILGLSNTLAIEGAKYGINCNTIVPVAASRLTQDIMPPDMLEQLKPNYVCPMVVFLCHESCLYTGGVYEAAGGWVGKYEWNRSAGKAFIPPTNLTVESIRDNWDIITDMSNSTTPTSLQEQMTQLLESMQGQNAAPSRKQRKVEVASVSGEHTYNEESTILYAVAVGLNPKEPGWLNYLYEGSDNFTVLPTYGTITQMSAVFSSPVLQEQLQKLNSDLSKVLHGEQYLELYRPLPPAATLVSKCRLLDVLDKGSGAVLIVEVDTFDEQGQKVMYSQWTTFVVGAGNFGGKRSSNISKPVIPPPSRQPDSFVEEKTPYSAAALYRLCGDKNPIHIDPSFASMGGFSEPIMHGLCSLGYATSHVLKQYANYDAKLFKSLMVRFAKPIIPGHTIRTQMWKEGNRIHFESLCVETGEKIITGAYVDLVGTASANLQQERPVSNNAGPKLKSVAVFSMLANRLKEHPELASKIQAVFQWDITKNGKPAATYTVDLKNGQGSIIEGLSNDVKPGCTLIIDDDDLIDMMTGKLDPQKAFMAGKLKLKGNIMLTQKLKPLLAMKPDGGAPKSGGPAVHEVPKLKSDQLFVQLAAKLKKEPDLASSINTIYQWNILKSGQHVSTWTLDLKNASGAVYKGPPTADKPDCTFILEDELFCDMMEGKADPQQAFMKGKLKITGDVLASQKLHALWENPLPADDNFSTKEASNASMPPEPAMKSDFVFEIFAERLIEEPELAKKMKVVYNWNIMKAGKKYSEWTVDLKTGAGSIYRGSPKSGKADVTLTMDDEDVIQLMLGKLNPQRAFMTGRLKIKGNIMLTQKLNQLWQEILKSGRAVELPILSAILADKPFDPNLRSETSFVELGKKVSRCPDLVQKLQTVFEWNITKNGQQCTQWTLDLKNNKGMLYRGPSKEGKPTSFITIDDNVFSDWVIGRLSAQQVLSSGQVKVSGNQSVASKLLDSFKPQSKL